MFINTNIAALNAARNLGTTGEALQASIAKLSSGYRINHAADDAAGLSIANTLRSNGLALQQAQRNASQATSVLQIAEGAVGTISDVLNRMKVLATEAGSGNVTDTDRTKIQAEFLSLQNEIDRITGTTNYQGQNLVDGTWGATYTNAGLAVVAEVSNITLSGTAADTYTFQVKADGKLTINNSSGSETEVVDVAAGAQTVTSKLFGISFQTDSAFDNTAAGSQLKNATTLVVNGGSGSSFMVSSSGHYTTTDNISVSGIDLTTDTLGIDTANADVSSSADAQAALSLIDTAISRVNTAIGTLGAAMSRVQFAQKNVASTVQNVLAAESTIRDTDVATEMTNYTKSQILQQAGVAMLAQANSAPQSMLKLFQ
jgi:flagellin